MSKSKYIFIVSMNVKKEFENLFNEVVKGTRSTNYPKLKQWNKIPSVQSTGNLLQTSAVVTSEFEYSKSFKEEWR